MNEPSEMNDLMDSNSEGVSVSGKSPDVDLAIKEDIIHSPRTYPNEAENIVTYESPQGTFYNTVEIKSDDSRRSVNCKDLDLINFDQRLSVDSIYSNGVSDCESSPTLNETFNQITDGVRPVNKHLKVKTADLLSVSGIGGRYSTSSENQTLNSDSINEDKENLEDANEGYYTADEIAIVSDNNSNKSPSVQLEHINGFHGDNGNQDLESEVFTLKSGTIENVLPSESTEILDKTSNKEDIILIEEANISNPENNINNNSKNTSVKLNDETISPDLHNINETIVENCNLNKTDSAANINETIYFESQCLNTNDLGANICNEIIVGNHNNTTDLAGNIDETIIFENDNLHTTCNSIRKSKLIDNDLEIKGVSENTETNHVDGGPVVTSIEGCHAEEVDVIKREIKSVSENTETNHVDGGPAVTSIEGCHAEDVDVIKREIKSVSENTETNHIDGGPAVISNEVYYVEEVDLTKECIEFDQLSPASPRSPIVEDPVEEQFVGETEVLASTLSQNDSNCNFKMTDLVEKLNQQQAEVSDLKLKLNAAQQHIASLELQIRQNEEIVIKTQAEALRTEQNYQQEVKQLKEKLNENSKIIEKDRIRELEEQVKDGKAREAKLLAEISQRTKDDLNYQKIMEQYETNLKARLLESKKLEEENGSIRTHLTNLELAFSDVHSKYEKTKAALQGVKANEEALLTDLEVAQATNVQHEERYESLKAYARTQIEKSNKENLAMKELHEMEMSKLKAFTRRLEIKLSSLEVSLQQKTEECEQLAALCDEVTGKQV